MGTFQLSFVQEPYLENLMLSNLEKDLLKEMRTYIDDDKLLEIYKTTSNKIEDLQNMELRYSDEFYTNFRSVNMAEDAAECESFIIISKDFLLGYEKKYYLQVYLDDYSCKIGDKQMTDYLDNNLSTPDEDWFFNFDK